ncbi:MAG: 2-phospho-L-lactate transferase CofD family protein, partial [Chloroflexota bacterium]
FSDALDRATTIVLCPSNPFVSIDPILAIPGVRGRLQKPSAPRIAVSPIIGGKAVRGPAGKMLAELGHGSSSAAVAAHYQGLCDMFFLDEADAGAASEITALGMRAVVAPTLMLNDDDKVRLARRVLDAAATPVHQR